MSKVPEFEKVKCATPDLAKQNLEKLKALFPGVVTEGPDGVAIDVEALKQECSATPIEGNVERYEFTWPGKRAARAAASTATNKTLRPCRAESVNFDTTENLYIEGDNLEVLKLLQTNYAGKVKMIYIDPPYNTGHDFVYRDRFSLTQKELENDAGAFDDDGNRFEVNDSSEARYHSNWCSMMYPRLKLARQLLTDDGVMFMSIDDNEVTNARKLCDEIYGEENFVGGLIHQRAKGGGQAKYIVKGHDNILLYSRVLSNVSLGRKKIVQKKTVVIDGVEYIKNDDVVRKVFGKYNKDMGDRRCFYEELEKYKGADKKAEIDALLKSGELFLEVNKYGMHTICRYEKIDDARSKLYSIIKVLSEEGKKDLEELHVVGFGYPKPVELLHQLCDSAADINGIVLDFFSGSATTAHAVMQLNAEDGGNRKFIMVQLPEPCAEDSEAAKAGYKNICEIGKERIRRAGKKISDELRAKSEELKKNAEKNGPSLFDDKSNNQTISNQTIPDIGFRVLKLDSSSLEDASETASGTQQQTLGLSRIKEDRTSEDLLFQILLESKLSLSDRIEKKKIEGNEVFFVSDTALVACLDAKAKMTEKFFTALAKFQPALAFFRDDLFESDSARINLAQIFKQFSPNTTITVI